MLSTILLVVLSLVGVLGDVSHILAEEQQTEPPPHRPYVFSYTAGRYPGHVDRQHTEVSDGSGVVRGTYSYVDPRHKVRTVDYVADKDGFHPVLNHIPAEHPADTQAVELAKEKHHLLYAKIAEDHAHPSGQSEPRQTAAVRAATNSHARLFNVIAEQHARIAAERELLQREEGLQHEDGHYDVENTY